MNKTINVNIGGLPYIVDEDAYLILRNYLQQIEGRLSPLERVEIMEDVENRIADIFSQYISNSVQVINTWMVREAISTIGQAEDFGEAQAHSKSNNQGNERKEPNQKCKGSDFRRSRSDKMLGGICGGLAPILGVDPTILRLLVVVLAVVSFSIAFWAYLILWVIVPSEEIPSKSK